ncbi:MAG: hypothetical protein K2I10_06880, partial [Lachnospiraceae bacterium]|nr:hypothetical protein [Lachnospiraceae bacterium]
LYLVIDELKHCIKANFKITSDTCLLGVSNNGNILARLLAYEMNLNVRCINHIGPRYFIEYKENYYKEMNEKNFILISDVICLGGEYRIARGIVHMLNAEMIGAVSVVKLRNVYRNDGYENDDIDKIRKVYSILVDINSYQIADKKINYKIFIDKEDENVH